MTKRAPGHALDPPHMPPLHHGPRRLRAFPIEKGRPQGPGIMQHCPLQISPNEPSELKVCSREIRPANGRSPQVRMVEDSLSCFYLPQARVPQIRQRQESSTEARAIETRLAQVRTLKACSLKTGPRKISTPQIQPIKLRPFKRQPPRTHFRPPHPYLLNAAVLV